MYLRHFMTLTLYACVLSAAAVAQSGIERAVIGSGGSDMTNGSHRITGTAGQTCIGISTSPVRIAGQGFWYQIKSAPTAINMVRLIPETPVLHQNYPNPFNPTTMIRFTLPREMDVSLVITDALGREVKRVVGSELLAVGTHSVRFDASGLPSDVYFYRLETPDVVLVRKMVLMR